VKEVLQSNVKTEENKSHKVRVELIRSVKKQTEPDGVKRSSGRSETEENRKRRNYFHWLLMRLRDSSGNVNNKDAAMLKINNSTLPMQLICSLGLPLELI
jgi:hypothetical protein